jgi:hypothetical protein
MGVKIARIMPSDTSNVNNSRLVAKHAARKNFTKFAVNIQIVNIRPFRDNTAP